jgi:hypothetical protein
VPPATALGLALALGRRRVLLPCRFAHRYVQHWPNLRLGRKQAVITDTYSMDVKAGECSTLPRDPGRRNRQDPLSMPTHYDMALRGHASAGFGTMIPRGAAEGKGVRSLFRYPQGARSVREHSDANTPMGQQ